MVFSSLLLAVSLLFPSAYAAGFTDVFRSTPYAGSVEQLRVEGIVQGYSDGTFRPSSTINRAEFTKILTGAAYGSAVLSTQFMDTHGFPDVPETAWFSPYILYAWQKGVIAGNPDGTFRPEANINYAEASKIIVKTFALPYTADIGTQWWEQYIVGLQKQQALPVSYRSAAQLVTRGEMAEMIVLARVRSGQSAVPSQSQHYLLRYHNALNFDDPWYRSSGRTTKYGDWDAELVTSVGGGTQVVVPSIKEILPGIGERSLMRFVDIENGPTVFASVVMESDVGYGDFYVFDPGTVTFRKLSVGRIPRLQWAYALSRNGRYLVAIETGPDVLERTLHILDLQGDAILSTVTVPSGEVLVCGDDLGSPAHVEWRDDATVEYAVFREGDGSCSPVYRLHTIDVR
jgi:hypothetical protein